MHILHIYKGYAPTIGGIENHIRALAEAQVALGHLVTVLVASRDLSTRVESLAGVRVIRAGRLFEAASTPVSLRLLLARLWLKPDIVHLHYPYPVGEVANYLSLARCPTVMTYHSDVIRQARLLRLYRPLLKRIIARTDRIVVTSHNYMTSSPMLVDAVNRCRVVPLGIDLDRFRSIDPSAVSLLRSQWSEDPVVLFVGVLRYYKGLTFLIEAMSRINAQLIIVGDGPMRPSLEAQAVSLGLGNRVHFTGRVSDSDLPLYYHAADVFCLPSCARSEAFGIVQLEALASGLPIVSTRLGTGVEFVNADNVSGLTVAPRSADALQRALGRILDDSVLRERLAAGALERAGLFTKERMSQAVMDVYRELVDD